jgi:hypothetical protein
MKKLFSVSLLVGAAVVLASGVLPQNANAQTQSPPPLAAEIPTTPVVPPPDIPSASPLAQIVRLTQAGVDEGIIMTCVTNSSGTFNLDSDRIIYLTDLGVPNNLITAMMQRDQQLQQQFAATQAAQQSQPAPPPQPAPVSQTAPPGTTEVAPQPETQPAPVTVNYFYDTLSPYGSWVVVAGYGRCWRPTACVYDASWQPYCDHGQWVYTDCGWYWNSSYAWGATFHYGRWFRDASVGWCWYPDTVWAPSWVTWRYSDNYCGWAPLPPRTTYQAGVGIVYNGGGVSVGFGFGLAANCFTFVPTRNFCDPHPHNYRVAPAQVTQVFNQTKIINNITVNGNGHNQIIVNNGIAVQSVASATQTQIRPVPVHEIDGSFAHDGHKQLSDGGGRVAVVNRPISTGYAGSTAQPSVPTRIAPGINTTGQNPQRSTGYFGNDNNRPAQNQFQQPNQTVTAPQTGQQFSHARNQTSEPVQNPSANYYLQPATAHWPQPETPRSYGRNSEARQNMAPQTPVVEPPANYSAPQPRNDGRQNYSQPAVNAAPQQNAPASGSTQPSSQSGGGHGGNQIWGAH